MPSLKGIEIEDNDIISVASSLSFPSGIGVPEPPKDDKTQKVSDVEKEKKFNLVWSGICRDETILVEVTLPDEKEDSRLKGLGEKPVRISRFILHSIRTKLLRNGCNVGWNVVTYAVTDIGSIHAIKFHVHEDKIPVEPGRYAKLQGFPDFMNGVIVKILERFPSKDQFMVQLPISEAEKVASTGILIVKSKNLNFIQSVGNVWTFAALYIGSQHQLYSEQELTCAFLEKIVDLTECVRETEQWKSGRQYCCQDVFAPVMKAQMDIFSKEGGDQTIDDSEGSLPLDPDIRSLSSDPDIRSLPSDLDIKTRMPQMKNDYGDKTAPVENGKFLHSPSAQDIQAQRDVFRKKQSVNRSGPVDLDQVEVKHSKLAPVYETQTEAFKSVPVKNGKYLHSHTAQDIQAQRDVSRKKHSVDRSGPVDLDQDGVHYSKLAPVYETQTEALKSECCKKSGSLDNDEFQQLSVDPVIKVDASKKNTTSSKSEPIDVDRWFDSPMASVIEAQIAASKLAPVHETQMEALKNECGKTSRSITNDEFQQMSVATDIKVDASKKNTTSSKSEPIDVDRWFDSPLAPVIEAQIAASKLAPVHETQTEALKNKCFKKSGSIDNNELQQMSVAPDIKVDSSTKNPSSSKSEPIDVDRWFDSPMASVIEAQIAAFNNRNVVKSGPSDVDQFQYSQQMGALNENDLNAGPIDVDQVLLDHFQNQRLCI